MKKGLHPIPSPSRFGSSRLFSTRRQRPRVTSQPLSSRILQSLLLGALVSLLLYTLLEPLSQGMAWCVQWGADLLSLPASLSQDRLMLGRELVLTRFGLEAHDEQITGNGILLNVALCAVLLVASRKIHRVPVRHAAFALCALHGVGIFIAWQQAPQLTHTLLSHTRLVADSNLLWLALSPLMLALAYYPVERSGINRALATLLFIGWQVLALPLKVLLAAVLIDALTPAVIPLLFLAMGPMLDVLLLSALYVWIMSWPLFGLRTRTASAAPLNPPA